jgi:hypothetical protein
MPGSPHRPGPLAGLVALLAAARLRGELRAGCPQRCSLSTLGVRFDRR